MSSLNETFKAIRRGRGIGTSETPQSIRSHIAGISNLRMSGTSEQTLINERPDTELGVANGREGNDWIYPDSPRGYFIENQDPGDRLQDFANSHLSEGPNPGRIPRPWNNRFTAKLGRALTGERANTVDIGLVLTLSGNASGGSGDAKYVPHTPTPRNQTMARGYKRTIDDAAPIPAVYIADPTRR